MLIILDLKIKIYVFFITQHDGMLISWELCMHLPKNGISSHLSAISTLVMCPHLPFHACLHLLRASHVLILCVQKPIVTHTCTYGLSSFWYSGISYFDLSQSHLTGSEVGGLVVLFGITRCPFSIFTHPSVHMYMYVTYVVFVSALGTCMHCHGSTPHSRQNSTLKKSKSLQELKANLLECLR